MKRNLAVIMVLSACLLLSACSSGMESAGRADENTAADERDVVAQAEELASGKSFFNGSTSYFNNYSSERQGEVFLSKGEVHIAEDENTLLMAAEPEEDVEITIKGSFERKKGQMQLVYEAPDGKNTVIADSEGEKDITSVDIPFTIKAGKGCFKLLGENSVFDFELRFEGLPENLDVFESFTDMENKTEAS